MKLILEILNKHDAQNLSEQLKLIYQNEVLLLFYKLNKYTEQIYLINLNLKILLSIFKKV